MFAFISFLPKLKEMRKIGNDSLAIHYFDSMNRILKNREY